MNVDNSACASSGNATAWEQINWTQCERQVRRLQARIVKATQEGRWNKVKALQRLLTRSFSGKALAVKRVTDNKGRRTSGVDGKIWNSPASKHKASGTLRRRGYQPKPLWLKLESPTEISIRRHVKIRGEANPFDPRWRAYMEDRAFFKKFGIHRREAGLKPSSSPAP
jgi:hypothetical protein